MANQQNSFVRSLLVPVSGGMLLLPTAVVAEVAPNQSAQPIIETQPEWLAGLINWRNQRVPLLNLATLLSLPPSDHNPKAARTVIMYGLESPQTMPFYAFPSVDVPRTLNISSDSLTNPTEEKNRGLIFRVKITNHESAWLPDLTYFENLLRKSQNLFLAEV
jgi:chemosensory pili system protein ChpC